jgi:endonuclease YncB( thermonuclease family)
VHGLRRPSWAFLGILAIAIVSWFTSRTPGPEPFRSEISGRATAIDGDSLRIGSSEIRLRGIDAPEGRQNCQRDGRDWPCGREAAAALRRLLEPGPLTCRVDRRDQHGRNLAVCSNGSGDINARMVADGWAVAYDRGNDVLYVREEQEARRARRGVWQGEFTPPRVWRQQNGIGGR